MKRKKCSLVLALMCACLLLFYNWPNPQPFRHIIFDSNFTSRAMIRLLSPHDTLFIISNQQSKTLFTLTSLEADKYQDIVVSSDSVRTIQDLKCDVYISDTTVALGSISNINAVRSKLRYKGCMGNFRGKIVPEYGLFVSKAKMNSFRSSKSFPSFLLDFEDCEQINHLRMYAEPFSDADDAHPYIADTVVIGRVELRWLVKAYTRDSWLSNYMLRWDKDVVI